jgi:hypothetical protein
VRDAKIDFVALPQIASNVRWKLGARTTDEARELSLKIVMRVYEKGLLPGEYWGGQLDYWPDEGCQAAFDRIEGEWISAGTNPQP